MPPLEKDIERALKSRGLFGPAQAAWVLSVANRIGRGRFQARQFREGQLIVWSGTLPAAELQLLGPSLIELINKKLGRPLVRSIRFKNQ